MISRLIADVGFGFVTASVLALAAVGFTLQFSVSNILNLAFGDIMTASAFVAYLVARGGGGLAAALLAGALFGGAFSVLVNRGVFSPFVRRGTGVFGIVVITLSIGLILQNLLLAIGGPTFFSMGLSSGRAIHLGPMVFTNVELVVIAISLASMASVHLLLRHTRLGNAMRATAANPVLARSSGVPTARVTDVAWLVSGVLGGLAGVALALSLATFNSVTGSLFLVPIIASAVLGGIGQPYGAMLGALVVGITSEISADLLSPQFKTVVAFVVLIVMLLIRPQGLFSDTAMRRQVAS